MTKKERILPGIISTGPDLYYPRLGPKEGFFRRPDVHACHCPFCGARISRDRYEKAKLRFDSGR
jgi:hypothetical protein